MAVDLVVREVREGDAETLIANIRPADAAECDALMGPGKLAEAVASSMKRSVMLHALVAGDGLMCIFGLATVNALGGQGQPWLLGTPLIDRHRSAFVRLNRPYIARMLEICPLLVNVVDARNVKSIAWLKRMGFTVLPPQPTGAAGLPFHPFFMTA